MNILFLSFQLLILVPTLSYLISRLPTYNIYKGVVPEEEKKHRHPVHDQDQSSHFYLTKGENRSNNKGSRKSHKS